MEDFERFVVSRWHALLRTAYLLTGDHHLAEELLQEALARAAQRWGRIVAGGDPEPYVRRILYTRAVDGHRARRRSVADSAVPFDQHEVPVAGEDAAVRRVLLREALARLTPRQRAVLVLRFYEDLTERETAATLGCSVSTVKSQSRHALARLRVLAPDLLEAFEAEGAT